MGERKEGETILGKFGLGKRNERGQMIVDFASRNELKIMNTFFQKSLHKKWTWQGPNCAVRNEIDYIMAKRSDTVKDVSVFTKANVGSDHRLIVGKVKIDTHCERIKMVKQSKRINKHQLFLQSEIFEQQLSNRFQALTFEDDINNHSNNIVKTIEAASKSVAGCQGTCQRQKQKLSSETKILMEKRRTMKQNGNRNLIEYREVCKTVRKKIREDCRKFQIQEISETIKNSSSLKKTKRQLAVGEKRISCILDKSGAEITNQDLILERIEEFYTELYSTNSQSQIYETTPHPEIPHVTLSEVRNALSQMPNGKAAGQDGISIESLKAGGAIIHRELAELYTRCLKENRIPKSWKTSKMILIHKKGDNRDLKNYRPISLLSNLYKVFTKILTVRPTRILGENQPI